MALFDSMMEEGRARRHERQERQRIARENMTTGCVLIFVIPFILFFLLNAVSGILYANTGNLASFILGGFGLLFFIGALITLCVKYGDIDKPRPGQVITRPDGTAVQVQSFESQNPPRMTVAATSSNIRHEPHAAAPNKSRTNKHRSHKRAVPVGGPDRHHADQSQVHLMDHHRPTTIPETPPPSYSLVMGAGRHVPIPDSRCQPDSRLIDYGNV